MGAGDIGAGVTSNGVGHDVMGVAVGVFVLPTIGGNIDIGAGVEMLTLGLCVGLPVICAAMGASVSKAFQPRQLGHHAGYGIGRCGVI